MKNKTHDLTICAPKVIYVVGIGHVRGTAYYVGPKAVGTSLLASAMVINSSLPFLCGLCFLDIQRIISCYKSVGFACLRARSDFSVRNPITVITFLDTLLGCFTGLGALPT